MGSNFELLAGAVDTHPRLWGASVRSSMRRPVHYPVLHDDLPPTAAASTPCLTSPQSTSPMVGLDSLHHSPKSIQDSAPGQGPVPHAPPQSPSSPQSSSSCSTAPQAIEFPEAGATSSQSLSGSVQMSTPLGIKAAGSPYQTSHTGDVSQRSMHLSGDIHANLGDVGSSPDPAVPSSVDQLPPFPLATTPHLPSPATTANKSSPEQISQGNSVAVASDR